MVFCVVIPVVREHIKDHPSEPLLNIRLPPSRYTSIVHPQRILHVQVNGEQFDRLEFASILLRGKPIFRLGVTTQILGVEFGLDEPEEKIRELSEMVERRCPVRDSLMRAVAVSGKVEVKRTVGAQEIPCVVLAEIPVEKS